MDTAEKLKALAEKALAQMDGKDYAAMSESGISRIMKIGIAFYKKQTEIAHSLCDQKP